MTVLLDFNRQIVAGIATGATDDDLVVASASKGLGVTGGFLLQRCTVRPEEVKDSVVFEGGDVQRHRLVFASIKAIGFTLSPYHSTLQRG